MMEPILKVKTIYDYENKVNVFILTDIGQFNYSHCK